MGCCMVAFHQSPLEFPVTRRFGDYDLGQTSADILLLVAAPATWTFYTADRLCAKIHQYPVKLRSTKESKLQCKVAANPSYQSKKQASRFRGEGIRQMCTKVSRSRYSKLSFSITTLLDVSSSHNPEPGLLWGWGLDGYG